ncbi:MAG TPA: MoxR family ATPase [Hyphomicrobiaceae bacterium]|nr:MoxR family ATPase [Hyphomicrobiaceae bacterium]
MSTLTQTDEAIVGRIEAAGERIQRVQKAASAVIFGQEQVIERTLVTILSGGHALLIGVPGLAKTLLVETLGKILGLDAKRIQFTPDLMPSDIIGAEVLEDSAGGRRSFRFVKGPIFAQLLMADEINRASPKTQSALLQAMQEHHVTVAGQRHDVPAPFHVLATQNPLEQEGTYPLPEAQLDRFLLQIDVSYPDQGAERRMLFATTGTDERRIEQILTGQELMAIQRLVRQLPVPDKVVEAILKLARSARPGTGAGTETDRLIAWGPGPRASQALMLAVRAKALIDGRLAPSVDDVVALAEPVLKHRMALTFAARAEGATPTAVINRLATALG